MIYIVCPIFDQYSSMISELFIRKMHLEYSNYFRANVPTPVSQVLLTQLLEIYTWKYWEKGELEKNSNRKSKIPK